MNKWDKALFLAGKLREQRPEDLNHMVIAVLRQAAAKKADQINKAGLGDQVEALLFSVHNADVIINLLTDRITKFDPSAVALLAEREQADDQA
jgi:hypothetical protein